MSILSAWRDWSRPPVRILTAEQQAEIAIDGEINATQDELTALKFEAKESKRDAKHLGRQAKAVRSALTHRGQATTVIIAAGVLGLLVMLANWALEYSLLTSMQIPPITAALCACMGSALFGGVGAVSLSALLEGPTLGQRAAGVACLLVLTGLAVLVVPVMAQARADESLGEQLRESQATVAILKHSSKRLSTSDRLRLEGAKLELQQMHQAWENTRLLFTALLAATLFGELVLAGYSYDLLARSRARWLDRSSESAAANARDASQEAIAQEASITGRLGQIGTDYVISLPTIERVTAERMQAMHTRPSRWAPRQDTFESRTTPLPGRPTSPETSPATAPHASSPVTSAAQDDDDLPSIGPDLTVDAAHRSTPMVWDGAWA